MKTYVYLWQRIAEFFLYIETLQTKVAEWKYTLYIQ